MKFHKEIILRLQNGCLHEVVIDGIRHDDVKTFIMAADTQKTVSYWIEHSAAYLYSKEATNDFGSKLGDDID